MIDGALAVQDGTSHRLSDDELGLIYRRVDEIKRRVTDGTISFATVAAALQTIIEGNSESLGRCKKRHRSEPLLFKRRPVKERRKSLAGMRLRSKEMIKRLFWHYKQSFYTGRFGKATQKKFHPEDIIVMMWEAENIPSRSCNSGRVPIMNILETEDIPKDREAMIVNQTIQWLGTNIGLEFLGRYIRTADIPI